MTFIKNIIENIDTEVIYTTISIGILATGILVKYFMKDAPISSTLINKNYPSTLNEKLKAFLKWKKKSNIFKAKLLDFDPVLKNLSFRHKHINSIKAYNKTYAEARKTLKKNKKEYKFLVKKLNSSYLNTVLNFKSHKSLLISQRTLLKSLMLQEPSRKWFFLPNDDPHLFILPVLLVLWGYLCMFHWNIARCILYFILACHTALICFLWRLQAYEPIETFWENLITFLKYFFWFLLP